jgi:hypothetical protein
MSIVVASAVALLGVTALAGAASTKKHSTKSPTVIPVLGAAVDVPVGQFVKAFAYCPKGYYVTGGGVYSGAITEIASSPSKDLRSWFADGTNSDPAGRTFQHRAVAVCAKGTPTTAALASAASAARAAQQAEHEYVARFAGSGGG